MAKEQQYKEPDYGNPVDKTKDLTPEKTFTIDGKEVPLSQLSPEVVGEWYEASTNRAKWQKANTDKAQEIAADRKGLEDFGDLEQAAKQLQQYRGLLTYFQTHPELEQYMLNHMQTNQQGVQQPPANQVSPQVMQVIQEQKKQISELTKQVSGIVKTDEQRSITEERETAWGTLNKKYPDLNREEFEQFVNEQAEKSGDLTYLYDLMYNVKQGMNTDQIRQDAQRQTLQNIQDRKGAVVDRGEGQPAVTVPENADIDMDLDDIFDKFAEETGNVEEPTIIE